MNPTNPIWLNTFSCNVFPWFDYTVKAINETVYFQFNKMNMLMENTGYSFTNDEIPFLFEIKVAVYVHQDNEYEVILWEVNKLKINYKNFKIEIQIFEDYNPFGDPNKKIQVELYLNLPLVLASR